MTVIIEINTVDVSDQIMFESLVVIQNLTNEVDTAVFKTRLYGDHTLDPTFDDDIVITDGATKIFAGKVMDVASAVESGADGAFGLLSAAIVKVTKASFAQERAEARLAQLVRNTTGATDDQIESLKQQAVALQRVGVIGDEVTIAGQSQLATFALTVEQIKQLTPALNDMIVAQNGVNATQEAAITVANAVGRALEGGVGALTRYGISLSDTQKELFETADRTEKVALLTEILSSNYGGKYHT